VSVRTSAVLPFIIAATYKSSDADRAAVLFDVKDPLTAFDAAETESRGEDDFIPENSPTTVSEA
jgi:hypothetical protein